MAEYPRILAQNRLADASSVSFTDGSGNALTQDSVYRIAHLYDLSRLSVWKGDASAAEQRLVFTFAAPVACDTFVLDKSFTLTSGTIYLDYSTDGANWTNAASQATPVSTTIYWKEFTSQTKQYWRIRITGLTAQPQIYNVWLGARIDLTFGPSGDFDPYEEELVGDGAHGAAGGFTWTHRFRRRVLRAGFENLNDTQFALITSWWTQAGRDGKSFWWLTWPTTEPTDPLYVNCEGAAKRFAFNGPVRAGMIEAYEVK